MSHGVYHFLSPARLFAVIPDLVEDFVQFLNASRGAVHAGKQFVHEPLTELVAFCVAPGISRLRPPRGKFLGQRFEP